LSAFQHAQADAFACQPAFGGLSGLQQVVR
jgi:hypothetical protein